MILRRFENRVAVITGGASGIGLAIVEWFAEEGAGGPARLGRPRSGCQRADPGGGRHLRVLSRRRVLGISGRRCVESSCRALSGCRPPCKQCRHGRGKGNWRVYRGRVGPRNECQPEVHLPHGQIRASLGAPVSATERRQHRVGFLVIGQQHTPAFVASKGGVPLLSKALALDLAPDRIRVNCVCPGITDTPMFRFHVNATPNPERTLRERLSRVPLQRPLSPREVADAVLYLSSDQSSGVTGTSIVVDAGYIAAAEWSP
jgi:NAD(P)-dependent dehydrogenase (short-subunit alcohol dehydrogenase family)